MSELEERLSAVLGNPQLMQQIVSMAQSLGGDSQNKGAVQQEEQDTSSFAFDPKLLQTIAQTAWQSGVDNNQKALLHALGPYLSAYRVHKLERAMRAARLAGAASSFLNAGGLQMLSGR